MDNRGTNSWRCLRHTGHSFGGRLPAVTLQRVFRNCTSSVRLDFSQPERKAGSVGWLIGALITPIRRVVHYHPTGRGGRLPTRPHQNARPATHLDRPVLRPLLPRLRVRPARQRKPLPGMRSAVRFRQPAYLLPPAAQAHANMVDQARAHPGAVFSSGIWSGTGLDVVGLEWIGKMGYL